MLKTLQQTNGFMPFSLYDLQEIWTTLKDGAYYSAFRKAIRLIDQLVNPPTGKLASFAYTSDEGTRAAECCENLEAWLEEHEDGEDIEIVARLGEPNVDAIPIVDIISVIRMLLELIKAWKGSQTINVGATVDAPAVAAPAPAVAASSAPAAKPASPTPAAKPHKPAAK